MRNDDVRLLIGSMNDARDAILRQKMQDLQDQQQKFENQRQLTGDERNAANDDWNRQQAALAQANADRAFNWNQKTGQSQIDENAARMALYKAQADREAAAAAAPRQKSWEQMSPMERADAMDARINQQQGNLQGILSRPGLTSDDPDLIDSTLKLSQLGQMRDALTNPPKPEPQARVDIFGDDPTRPAGSAMVPQSQLGQLGYSMAKPQVDPTTGLPVTGGPAGGPPGGVLGPRLTPTAGPANANPLADMTLGQSDVLDMLRKNRISPQQAAAYGQRRGWATPKPGPN